MEGLQIPGLIVSDSWVWNNSDGAHRVSMHHWWMIFVHH